MFDRFSPGHLQSSDFVGRSRLTLDKRTRARRLLVTRDYGVPGMVQWSVALRYVRRPRGQPPRLYAG